MARAFKGGHSQALPDRRSVSDGVVACVRGIEWVSPTGELEVRPDAETKVDTATSSEDRALGMALASLAAPRAPALPGGSAPAAVIRPSFENPYAEMQFPNAEYRLLSLFRLWTVINYFFAYKHLMDQDCRKR